MTVNENRGLDMTIARRELKRSMIPRLAVIGCGAAAKEFCFPVLARFPGFRDSVIAVDRIASQAASVATEFGIRNHCTDYQSLFFEPEAAIVTTPHHLHAEQAIHFLRQGKPVFVEKPLGMSAAEVTKMLAVADTAGATLMVNNCRRLFPAYRRVGELLRSGEFGAVTNINISDGSPFDWNSVTAFYLRNAARAKGVFLDRGAHTVDVVCWWLADRPQTLDARYDAQGGAEGLMKVELALGDATIQLLFSRFYKLENCYTVECEKAQIRGRLFQSTKFDVIQNGRRESIQVGKPVAYRLYAWQLLENFIEVVQGVARPVFTAADVAPSIGLIDEAYQQATPFESSWYDNDPNLRLLRTQPLAPSV